MRKNKFSKFLKFWTLPDVVFPPLSEDNVREWTGVEIAKSQRAVENKEKSVVPQRPPRLRDS